MDTDEHRYKKEMTEEPLRALTERIIACACQ
jgi:hypothetical protein